MNFADRLLAAIDRKKTPLIVGLDPVYESLPSAVTSRCGGNDPTARVEAILQFARCVLGAVAPHVPAVKINSAYFESYHWRGVQAYIHLIQEAQALGLLVIGDVKRADIGHTAAQYAQAALADHKFTNGDKLIGPDAITINPYFGFDGVAPFLDVARRQDKGIFVLLRTSNASAGEIQEIPTADGRPLFMHTAGLIDKWGRDLIGAHGWSGVGAVVGATSGESIARLRGVMPHTPFLIPGIGAQSGSLTDCAHAFRHGAGAVISASRSIIFAYRESLYQQLPPENWIQAVEQATLRTKTRITEVLDL